LASREALYVHDDKDYAQDENSTNGNVMLSLMSGYPHGLRGEAVPVIAGSQSFNP
jgi:hypothetical protein